MTDLTSLHEELAGGRLALFLGAELPAALTGLPSRAELAAGLALRHGLPAGLSLAAAAQRVMQRGNRFAFTDYLGQQLDALGKPPQPLHRLIAQLPAPLIISTAYDSLLEQAFQQAQVPINRIVRDSDLAFASPQRRTLIKLYGDLQQRDTLVVTEDDHYGLWRSRDKEGLLDEVRRAMRGNAVLFLGYNLADPDFLLLWHEVLDRMGRFALGAYAIGPGMPPDERSVWEDRQVHMIDLEPLELLGLLVGFPGANIAPQELPARSLQPKEHAAMPTADTIAHQQKLLQTHRRTLGILVGQQAQHTAAFVPPHIMHGIAEARDNIARIKGALRGWGVLVEDEPNDAEEPAPPPAVAAKPAPAERIDLAIVAAMPEELEPVLDLIGGRAQWSQLLIDKFIHYRAAVPFGEQTLQVVACSLWNYGGNPTTAALLRLKSLRPRLIGMTGICAGWDAKGVQLGDVVVADRAFHSQRGRRTPGGFEADTQTYQPPPWLMQWLRDFSADKQWFRAIAAPRPRTLRYQAEWLLCRIAERGADYPASDADWDEVSASEIDVMQARERLAQHGWVDEAGGLTAAGTRQTIVLRQQQRGKLQPMPDAAQPTAHYGAFASSEAIVADNDPFRAAAQHVRKVRAIELEVAALFAAAAEIEVPAFAVKGVSDYGTPEKDDAFHGYAAEAAVRWMHAFVAQYAVALLGME